MPTLSDKLKSLGVKIGARDLPAPRKSVHAIEEVMDGRSLATDHGDAFIVETTYPPDYRHGHAALTTTAPLTTIVEWARDERLSQLDPDQFLFIDTETTGLAGGTGTYAFLIGVGRLEGERFKLTQFFLRDPGEERAVLDALTQSLSECRGLVTFNGKSFDVPLLSTRYIANGFQHSFATLPHLDLLPLARRLWRERLESRALGSLEKHILGAARAQADVPGWLIPTMYFEYLRTGDARPLAGVFYHNAMDVLAMAALLNHISQLLDDPLGFAANHALDLIAIARLHEHLGRRDEAVLMYRRGLELELPEDVFRQTAQRLALVERRRGEIFSAVELWREAARRKEIYAYVELAKYYEHRKGDYGEAMRWTREALARIKSRESAGEMRRVWQAPLERRIARLESKLKRKRDA